MWRDRSKRRIARCCNLLRGCASSTRARSRILVAPTSYGIADSFSYLASISNAKKERLKRTFPAKIVSPLASAGSKMTERGNAVSADSPADVTQILQDWSEGDATAPEKL